VGLLSRERGKFQLVEAAMHGLEALLARQCTGLGQRGARLKNASSPSLVGTARVMPLHAWR
jgi:hypothetical protein